MTTEQKQVKKPFFTVTARSECAWLNRLGQQGYRLLSRKDSRYLFEISEGTVWYYHMEWLDCSAESEPIQDYLASLNEQGICLAATYSLWAYFVSSQPISPNEMACKRTAAHYRNVAIFVYAADVVTAMLIGYQLAIRDFLQVQDVLMEAPVLKHASNLFATLLNRIAYGGKLLFYRYGQIWSRLFGPTKASLVLSVLVPLAILLTAVGAYYLTEAYRNRYVKSESEAEKGEPSDDTAEVSGTSAGDC